MIVEASRHAAAFIRNSSSLSAKLAIHGGLVSQSSHEAVC